MSRERSLERERDHRDQTVRDWTARDYCGERSRNIETERNFQERASDRICRDFQSSTHSRGSERHSSQPYRERSLNHGDHHFESRRGRESHIEHDWDNLNVERDLIQKEHHNQFDREQNFSKDRERKSSASGNYLQSPQHQHTSHEHDRDNLNVERDCFRREHHDQFDRKQNFSKEFGHPSTERKSSASGNYFLQETKRFREDQVSFGGRPEDRFLRPSSPKSFQAEKAPVRHFSSSERSHTTTQGNYRPLNLHPEDPKNMYPGRPAANSYVRGYNSQGDLDVCLVKELVRRACSSEGGAVTFDRAEWEQFCKQVIRSVPSGDMDTFFHRFPHIFSCEQDPMYHPRRILRVKTTLELCKDHCSKDGCKRLVCEGLHCCKFFLFGTCKFNQKCNFGHYLNDDHNQQLLAKHFLDTLTPPQIGVLFKSGKASQVFPKVCKFYNVGEGCQFGEKGEKCRAMHVCRHYLLDDCNFGKRCKRSHNIFDAQPKNILKKHGIRIDRSPKQVLEELRAAMKQDGCEDGEDLSDGEIRSSDEDEFLGAVGPAPQRPRRSSSCDSTSSGTKDSLEICTFFLRAKCSYGKACANKHPQYGMPYLWQYEVGREWQDLERASNDEIELNFCDPDQSECFTNNRPTGMMGINFEAMKYRLTNGESGNVRRLSTKSSQRRATNFLYLTQWHWYWKDSGGKWEEFGKHDDESITSDELEEEFSSNPNSHLSYSADDGTNYVADLQNMKRKNSRSGSVTDIRRRPDLFDPHTKKPIRKIERQTSSPASTLSQLNIGTTYPKTWNLEFKSDNDFFQIVPVQRGQPEFETIQRLFSATIANVPLKSVRRIQNAELWDAFYRKKTWMEKKLKPGGKLNVRNLFHGTKELYVDAICQQGFDWRISGSSVGTKYGKGSYFARDAIYSSKYTDSRKLFVVQVLVGEFAQGDARMVRPPPKDARQPFGELYDSVVNNPLSPEIFVVFTHEQAYPEYLIEY